MILPSFIIGLFTITSNMFNYLNLTYTALLSKREVYPRIQYVIFYSDTSKMKKKYTVVLPQNYDKSSHDWPVLFFLHERGRNEMSLIDIAGNRKILLKATFVTVLPEGNYGWYIDSPVKDSDKYEQYTAEVIPHARNLFNLSRKRTKTGICGWSMGGYGTVIFAERHSEEFGSVSSIIGLLDFPSNSYKYSVPINRLGKSQKLWDKFNPLKNAEKLKNIKINIITIEDFFDRPMNEAFHKATQRTEYELSVPNTTGRAYF